MFEPSGALVRLRVPEMEKGVLDGEHRCRVASSYAVEISREALGFPTSAHPEWMVGHIGANQIQPSAEPTADCRQTTCN
jgi:hypothetical protein